MTGPAPTAPPRPRNRLAVVLGSLGAAAALFSMVPAEESGRAVEATVQPDGEIALRNVAGRQYLAAYLDIVGVPTACDGITRGIRLGQRYTPAQCDRLLEDELVAHAREVIACVPTLHGRANQAAAAVSLAYNVGGPAFCRSTAARHFNARRWHEGCEALTMWNKAGGRVVRGLVLRRARERALCLKGLGAKGGAR